MTLIPELVTNKESFFRRRKECESIIDTQKRLPDFVFRHSFAKYYAIEHAEIHRAEFASFLSEMACVHKDESVHYMTIDPDPEDYYYRHYQVFGLASFEPLSLKERYLPVMSRDGQADSFLTRGGDVGTFWGSSLQWGIFCDRISWETAVIAVSRNVDVERIGGFRCLNAFDFSDYIKSQYAAKLSVAQDCISKFVANYRI